MFGFQLGVVLLYYFALLLGKEHVGAEWHPWRLNVFFDLRLFFLGVRLDQVTIFHVPFTSLFALFEGLEFDVCSFLFRACAVLKLELFYLWRLDLFLVLLLIVQVTILGVFHIFIQIK